jgi:hypothetical protein
MENINVKHVTDLGAAAYVLMHKYKIAGKKGQAVYFEVPESETEQFEALNYEYISDDFHKFDSCLMSLKKMREYTPPKKDTTIPVMDLGAGAYILMKNKNRVLGKDGQTIYFDASSTGTKHFHGLRLEYYSSEFHRFDHCLMALKKIGDYTPEGL